MRRRFAIPLIALIGYIPWFWNKPPAPDIAPADQAAQHLSTYAWPRDADWAGGFSGIDLTPDGRRFYIAGDRGHLITGTLTRTPQGIGGVENVVARPLVDKDGNVRDFPHTDAEGVALDDQGRIYVSFEQAHRVLMYDTPTSAALWPAYTRSWRALGLNSGLEALAIDANDTLITIPEGVLRGAFEALVYRRFARQTWEQPFTLPLTDRFVPTGADFGPDGRFYILERGHYSLGFTSQVRAMTLTETGFTDIQTILQTPWGTHGNLEGLSVWRDQDGHIRLTMVSDDNFLPFLRSEIVEYILRD